MGLHRYGLSDRSAVIRLEGKRDKAMERTTKLLEIVEKLEKGEITLSEVAVVEVLRMLDQDEECATQKEDI